ncbi:apolipoprotein L6 isoform X1 [Loxodonta africana]|uniref:apolipoprotein L6 isoform X1 n=1 Tax=Loxodonta africana TaxID=9785 RepID=UPI000C812E88|nr:apolipoprotein L6 isoform X1 [Loxodonta africana]
MATETSQICKENRTTNGDTSNSAVDEMSMPLVPPKLLDIQAVEEYEAGVGLQSGKDDVLLWEDVKWTLQEDMHLSAGERTFLEKFHLLKCDLEVCISKLHALADHMDTTHETFTKTNVVVSSIAVVSGVMSILGLALCPATLGGSLVLSAAGNGLGLAAGATRALTGICKHLHNKKAQAQASSLVLIHGQGNGEAIGREALNALAVCKVLYQCRNGIKDIKKNINAFKTAKAHPRLAAAAKQFLTSDRVSAQSSRQVQRAFESTTLAMTKSARLLGAATAGLFLSVNLATLLKDWKQMKEGERTEAAKELRAQAQDLEEVLTELTQLYESLRQKELLQEKSLLNSTFEGAMWDLPQSPVWPGEEGCQIPAGRGEAQEPLCGRPTAQVLGATS